MDFNDIPMFTRMAFKKYNAPVLIFTNDLTVSLYTSLIGYYIDKNGILKNVLSSSVKGKEAYLYSEDEEFSIYCIKDVGLESYESILQSLRMKDNGAGAAAELEDFLNEIGM